jgi:DNA-binding transcriptional regulator YhcF (GntR family)
MIDSKISLRNLGNNDIPKYKRVVNAFIEAIETNLYKSGDSIPSINEFSKKYEISRDTVFKAYTLLKEQSFIKSTPNKGYYVVDSKIKILLLISTFKAYKEVLYHSLMNNLPNNVIVDLQFHHYNVNNFTNMLNRKNGRYYKYVVMGFDHPKVTEALSKINPERLLLIDWKVNVNEDSNYVLQDFGKKFYKCLEEAKHLFQKYDAVNFIYPEFTYHPWESVIFFEKFCKSNNLKYNIIKDSKEFIVERNMAYISVSDRMLYELLDQCRFSNFELGKDVGVLSYNDTPLKRFTYKGISVVSIDFKEFGVKIAGFIKNNDTIQDYIKTKLIIRDSL